MMVYNNNMYVYIYTCNNYNNYNNETTYQFTYSIGTVCARPFMASSSVLRTNRPGNRLPEDDLCQLRLLSPQIT